MNAATEPVRPVPESAASPIACQCHADAAVAVAADACQCHEDGGIPAAGGTAVAAEPRVQVRPRMDRLPVKAVPPAPKAVAAPAPSSRMVLVLNGLFVVAFVTLGASLVLMGLLPVVLVGLVIFLPALAPLLLVAFAILGAEGFERRRQGAGRPG